MTPDSLERYLCESIPLTAAMGIRVEVATPERVILTAPLAPNVNHRETAFGGSLSALATLAGWSLLHLRLREAYPKCRLVVAENTVHYLRPVYDGFSAVTTEIDDNAWRDFLEMIDRKGRGRIPLRVVVQSEDRDVAVFEGRFVALT